MKIQKTGIKFLFYTRICRTGKKKNRMKIQETGIKFLLCSFEGELKSEPFVELVKIKQNENIENGYKISTVFI